MQECPNIWHAISAIISLGVGVPVAVYTWKTYRVIREYTAETKKLREEANEQTALNKRQLSKMTEQYDLSSKIAVAQTGLTFTFRPHSQISSTYLLPESNYPLVAYPLIAEGKSFQNLTVESVSPSEPQRFILLDSGDQKIRTNGLILPPRTTHVLFICLDQYGARNTSECFRLTYVDALRYTRWDEFNFKGPDGDAQWKPVWRRSGYTVTSNLTIGA